MLSAYRSLMFGLFSDLEPILGAKELQVLDFFLTVMLLFLRKWLRYDICAFGVVSLHFL